MITTDRIRVGQYGFTIRAQFLLAGAPLDISTATSIELRLERPDSTTMHLTASLESTGLDGWVAYPVQPGDLAQAGDWRFQFIAVLPDAYLPLEPVAFTVGPNIP